MKISQIFKDFKERKGSQVERRRGRRREDGQKGWPYRHFLPPADSQALQNFTLGLQRREDWNSALQETRTEPEFEFSSKKRWSVSNPQLRLRPFDQIPASRTAEIEKKGRIGKVKGRKERGKEREMNKVSCSLLIGALWPVVHARRRPGTKGSQLWLLGLVHW